MKNQANKTAIALLLIAVSIVYRICTGMEGMPQWLLNFAPISAIALCGAIYLPGRLAFVVPMAALFISDLVLNIYRYHFPMVAIEMGARYFALAIIIVGGWKLRNHARLSTVVPASAAGSFLFYIVTNTGSWIDQAGYAKTFAGWVQAMTTGLPGYAPTWMFYRSTLISDLLFTALFVLCMSVTQRPVNPVALEPEAATAR